MDNSKKPSKEAAVNGQSANSDSLVSEQSNTNEPTTNGLSNSESKFNKADSSQAEPESSESGESVESATSAAASVSTS